MAAARRHSNDPAGKEESTTELNLGRTNSKAQEAFFLCHAKYICYGGARGGGKSWAILHKAAGGALRYPGIRMLLIRRGLEELDDALIGPLCRLVPPPVATYNKSSRLLRFANGSAIRFGNLTGYGAAVEGKYQGQSYDWLLIDEATNFTEAEFRGLCACVRGVNPFPKRVYLTCNPGGVGHNWVKRLFIDRNFRRGEEPEEYQFFPATVDDNRDLMAANPDYVQQLELLPPDKRQAHRYGDWNALAGSFFPEFTPERHVCRPFPIPSRWIRYRAFDYGLDMFACLWAAISPEGVCYVYRECFQEDLVVSQAAAWMHRLTEPEEIIQSTIAPPDMWSRVKDSGLTMAELFQRQGIALQKAGNSRVQGWAALKELMQGKLVIFDTCQRLIADLSALQHDGVNPNDAAKEPHDITHGPDALRYLAQSYRICTTSGSRRDDPYRRAMCGGAQTGVAAYLEPAAIP